MQKITRTEEAHESLTDAIAFLQRENLSGIFAYFDDKKAETIVIHSGTIEERIAVFDAICEEMNERTADEIASQKKTNEMLLHTN